MKKCPKCKGKNLVFHAGGVMGLYKCKDCGLITALIIEEDDNSRN